MTKSIPRQCVRTPLHQKSSRTNERRLTRDGTILRPRGTWYGQQEGGIPIVIRTTQGRPRMPLWDRRQNTRAAVCMKQTEDQTSFCLFKWQMIEHDQVSWSVKKYWRIGDPDKIKREKTVPIYRVFHSGNCGWRCWRLTMDVRFPLWCDVVDWCSTDNLWTLRKRQSVKSDTHDLFHSNLWTCGLHSCSWCPTIAMKNPWASCCVSIKTRDPPFLRLNVMSGISEMSFQRKKQSSSWWTNVNGKENDARIWKSP